MSQNPQSDSTIYIIIHEVNSDSNYLMDSIQDPDSNNLAATADQYEDLLPVMAEKLDVEKFVEELCGGFRLLADEANGLITPESLMRNSILLGLEGMSREDALGMVREGDIDGDGGLNEMEFCILMVRLSPEMMQDAEVWLEKAIDQELQVLVRV